MSSNASGEKSESPAIAKPSDLAAKEAPGSAQASGGEAQPAPARDLPPPITLDMRGGESIELLEDQVFADKVVVRKGEKGRALYPSSQAASWVVHFPRVGPKLRVLGKDLLKVV